ncbi:hypothetical protein D3C80_1368680 [compost metagenome]
MVLGQLLGTVITGGNPGDGDLANAEGFHIGKVFFQDQPPDGDFLFVQMAEDGVEFIVVADHVLASSGCRSHRLEPQRALGEQQFGCHLRIGQAEYGVALEQGVGGTLGERIGPALGAGCPGG